MILSHIKDIASCTIMEKCIIILWCICCQQLINVIAGLVCKLGCLVRVVKKVWLRSWYRVVKRDRDVSGIVPRTRYNLYAFNPYALVTVARIIMET